MDYLDKNLNTLHLNLNDEAFNKCLQLLWGVMFEFFYRLTEESVKVQKLELRNVETEFSS